MFVTTGELQCTTLSTKHFALLGKHQPQNEKNKGDSCHVQQPYRQWFSFVWKRSGWTWTTCQRMQNKAPQHSQVWCNGPNRGGQREKKDKKNTKLLNSSDMRPQKIKLRQQKSERNLRNRRWIMVAARTKKNIMKSRSKKTRQQKRNKNNEKKKKKTKNYLSDSPFFGRPRMSRAPFRGRLVRFAFAFCNAISCFELSSFIGEPTWCIFWRVPPPFPCLFREALIDTASLDPFAKVSPMPKELDSFSTSSSSSWPLAFGDPVEAMVVEWGPASRPKARLKRGCWRSTVCLAVKYKICSGR